jgi:2-polyprenyl-6-methoxyphenol hydroxylase-like FAD-dependent oxidoreductase
VDIAIVGGGVGGLALALSQRGIPCRVYESAPEVKELGVGITLLPHAMRELTALALGEALARHPGRAAPVLRRLQARRRLRAL